MFGLWRPHDRARRAVCAATRPDRGHVAGCSQQSSNARKMPSRATGADNGKAARDGKAGDGTRARQRRQPLRPRRDATVALAAGARRAAPPPAGWPQRRAPRRTPPSPGRQGPRPRARAAGCTLPQLPPPSARPGLCPHARQSIRSPRFAPPRTRGFSSRMPRAGAASGQVSQGRGCRAFACSRDAGRQTPSCRIRTLQSLP